MGIKKKKVVKRLAKKQEGGAAGAALLPYVSSTAPLARPNRRLATPLHYTPFFTTPEEYRNYQQRFMQVAEEALDPADDQRYLKYTPYHPKANGYDCINGTCGLDERAGLRWSHAPNVGRYFSNKEFLENIRKGLEDYVVLNDQPDFKGPLEVGDHFVLLGANNVPHHSMKLLNIHRDKEGKDMAYRMIENDGETRFHNETVIPVSEFWDRFYTNKEAGNPDRDIIVARPGRYLWEQMGAQQRQARERAREADAAKGYEQWEQSLPRASYDTSGGSPVPVTYARGGEKESGVGSRESGVGRQGAVSTEGYKANSPDRFNAYNIIPSNQITMKGVKFPVMGVDNLGNRQLMMPGVDYIFPGQSVLEVPFHGQSMYQQGGPAPRQKLQKGGSVVDYLQAAGVDASMSNRRQLAGQFGIKNYRGTTAQNLQLLQHLQSGTSPGKRKGPAAVIPDDETAATETVPAPPPPPTPQDVHPTNGFVNLKDYGIELYKKDGTYSPEAIQFAEQVQAANPGTKVKFECNEKGCFAIANRISEGETGKRLYGPAAWKNTGKSLWQAPTLQEYQTDSGQPLPDPQDYTVPQEVKSLPRGLYVGLNRKNNRKGKMATTMDEADDSYDYANNQLYPGGHGYEHMGYSLGDGRLFHGTGGDEKHPGYFVIDDMTDNDISLSGYGKYAPVEVLSPNRKAEPIPSLYAGPKTKKGEVLQYALRGNEKDSERQRQVKQELVSYFNDPNLDKRLMQTLGISQRDLEGLKPVVMGVLGNKTHFGDQSLGSKAMEAVANLFSGSSVGPFQTDYTAVPQQVRDQFGIKKQGDLKNLEKAYPAALSSLYQAFQKTQQARAEGKLPGLNNADPYFSSVFALEEDPRVSGGAGEIERQPLQIDRDSAPYMAMQNAYDLIASALTPEAAAQAAKTAAKNAGAGQGSQMGQMGQQPVPGKVTPWMMAAASTANQALAPAPFGRLQEGGEKPLYSGPVVKKGDVVRYSLKPNDTDNERQRRAKQTLVNYFNNPYLDRELMKTIGLSYEELQGLKPMMMGVLGNESSYNNMSWKGVLKEAVADLFPTNSVGPFQVKLGSIPQAVRDRFGITDKRELYDMNKGYAGSLAAMYQGLLDTDQAVAEGKHPELVGKDRFSRGLYSYNMPAMVKGGDDRINSIWKDKNEGWGRRLLTAVSTPFTEADKQAFFDEKRLRMDKGSYPVKALERAYDLNTTIVPPDEVEEWMVAPTPEPWPMASAAAANQPYVPAPFGEAHNLPLQSRPKKAPAAATPPRQRPQAAVAPSTNAMLYKAPWEFQLGGGAPFGSIPEPVKRPAIVPANVVTQAPAPSLLPQAPFGSIPSPVNRPAIVPANVVRPAAPIAPAAPVLPRASDNMLSGYDQRRQQFAEQSAQSSMENNPLLEQRKWAVDYMRSPGYLAALQKEGYTLEDAKAEQKARIKNVFDTPIDFQETIDGPLRPLGAYQPKEQTGDYWNSTLGAWVPRTGNPFSDTGGRLALTSRYKPYDFNPKTGYETTPLHELIHASTDGNARIRPTTMRLLRNNLNMVGKPYTRVNDEVYGYVDSPTEAAARFGVIKFLSDQQKIYDPRTQQFTKAHYQQLMKNPAIQKNENFKDIMGALKGKTPEEKERRFIYMMNNMAANDQPAPAVGAEMVAKYGGDVRPMQVGGGYADNGLYPYGVINPFDRDLSQQTPYATVAPPTPPAPPGATAPTMPLSGIANQYSKITIGTPNFTFNQPAGTGATTKPPAKTSSGWGNIDPAYAFINTLSGINNALEANARNRDYNDIRLRNSGDAIGAWKPTSRGDWTVNGGYLKPDRNTVVQFGAVPIPMAQMGGGYYPEPTELEPIAPGPMPTLPDMAAAPIDMNMDAGIAMPAPAKARRSPVNVPDIQANQDVRPNEASWKAVDYYVNQKGLAPHVAAGIIGNLYQESRLKTEVKEQGHTGNGRGIAQWDVRDRWKGLHNWAEKQNRDPYDLYTQLDYILEEPGEGAKVLEALADARTPEEASYIFGKVYERPLNSAANWGTRAGIARKLFEGMAGDALAQRGKKGSPKSKLGGEWHYQQGGEYMVTPEQLREILANGGEVEYV